jgi:hypothetical protein
MNIRIAIAGMFIRGRGATKWLRMVDEEVCSKLAPMIDDEKYLAIVQRKMPTAPADYRRAMAEKHSQLVSILVAQNGKETGLRLGHEAMYGAGVGLGEQLGKKLHISNDEGQLVAAAKLLYRILDIDFELEKDGYGMKMLVKRCSLANGYGPITCQVICGMDEGVVHGLNPKVSMAFKKRNGEGPCICEASLAWEAGR